MSNKTLDRYLEREYLNDEYACCDCGYRRGAGHHPKIRCPKTGRCGSCGNEWPCADHAPEVDHKVNQAFEFEFAGRLDKRN